MNLPKFYANVCQEKDVEYSDYENFEVKIWFTRKLRDYKENWTW